MIDVDKLLIEEKEKFGTLEAPPELEARLKQALNKSPQQKPKPRKNIGMIAAVLVALLFFSYNFDAIAYYGKKIIGYDEVISGALKDLNEQGHGQTINKKYQFKNGVILTLDGIMLDDNRLIAFYTLKSPNGNISDYHLSSQNFKGIARYNAQGGYGKSNEEFTQVKWIFDFEPPYFFERNLTFNFDLHGPDKFYESGEIKFKLDRSKAMGFTIKQDIDKSVKLTDTTINFETITASATQTVIKGSIGTALEYLNNVRQNQYFQFNLDYDLLANGQKLQSQGGGMGTSAKGIEFEGRFDPLPQELKKLEIKLTGVTESEPVEQSIDLNKDEQNKSVDIEGNEIIINQIYTKNDKTYVTITTEDHVLLEKVYLIVNDEQISLEKTIPGNHEKSLDGKITSQRTLEFLNTGAEYKLLVKKIRYKHNYDELIEIPLD